MTKPYLLWSLADDFSINNTNPSSVWSYGYKKDTTGSLTLFTHLLADPHNTNVYAWFESGVDWNTPGQFSVARYTAPIDGNYSLTAIFSHIDIDVNTTNASTGVYIICNNLYNLFDDIIYGMK
ncbi:2903_t:CDS:2, partial [Racocetra fulgida]